MLIFHRGKKKRKRGESLISLSISQLDERQIRKRVRCGSLLIQLGKGKRERGREYLSRLLLLSSSTGASGLEGMMVYPKPLTLLTRKERGKKRGGIITFTFKSPADSTPT